MNTLLQDIRYALRLLRKSPGFTAVAVLTLALGIGANVSMLGVVDSLMFRVPAFVRAPQQLVEAGPFSKQQPDQPPVLSYYEYCRLAANAHFIDLATKGLRAKVGFGQGAAARPIFASYVSHRHLQVLGGHTLIGRWFSALEDQPAGSPAVVVLGYDLWQGAFGGDPKVLGRTVQIDGQERTIVGVTPKGFTGTGFLKVDAWLPICAFREISLPNLLVTPVGRLRENASVNQAAAEITSLLRQDGALENQDQVVRVEPLFGSRWKTLSSNGRISLWIAGVALIVFLIACANVSSLELAQMAQRRHEMAIRQHLGATRARVMTQVLIEGLLVGAMGGLAALAVALMVQPIVRAFLLPEGFYEGSFLNWRLLATAAVLAIIAGCASAFPPAWRGSDSRLAETLRRGDHGRMREGTGLRWTLVVAQIALALLLAVGAGLLIRSLNKVDAINLGFEPNNLLQATLDLPADQDSWATVGAVYARLRVRAERVPGVADAALANMLTVMMEVTFVKTSDSGKTFRWMGMPRAVTPNYFQTMGIPILKGRSLLDSDIEGAEPVAVVSESIAHAIWPGQNPLGKCMHTGTKPGCAHVVGVVPDAWPTISLDDSGPPGSPGQFYVPLSQAEKLGIALPAPDGLLIRTKVIPSAMTKNLFSALESVSPDGRYIDIQSYANMLDEQTRSWRMGATMFSLFGGLALALAVVGIYGVVAFVVRQRTHEIGIRMALGAQRGDILRMVIREGMLLVAVGIALGIGGALALTRFLGSLLFGIRPTDPATFAVVAVLLTLVALAACYIPARRATKVDPMVALRHE